MGRETQPEGIGWELFDNYLIARDKFKPEYFLYENNKSMAGPIREQITAELGVEPILINSARVSAQSRQRLYWTNIPDVKQPEDRGIVLRDILESGVCWREKAYTLMAAHERSVVNAIARNGKFPFNGAESTVFQEWDRKLCYKRRFWGFCGCGTYEDRNHREWDTDKPRQQAFSGIFPGR